MKSIRRNTFETNSSSTHSLCICPKEVWSNFIEDNGVYFYNEGLSLYTIEDIRESWNDFGFEQDVDKMLDEDIKQFIDRMIEEDGYYSMFSRFVDNDIPWMNVFDAEGKPIVVYGVYSWD